jgi:hypothetical protein
MVDRQNMRPPPTERRAGPFALLFISPMTFIPARHLTDARRTAISRSLDEVLMLDLARMISDFDRNYL